MPHYMLLIYAPVDNRPSPEQLAAEHPKWMQYTQTLKDEGVFVDGDALQGIEVATTVRSRDGEIQLTDGPFAETKEFLGGYYVIDCPDLDTALGWASRVPNIDYGSVEVRPVWDTSQAHESGERVEARRSG
jgi:hypothetical protein